MTAVWSHYGINIKTISSREGAEQDCTAVSSPHPNVPICSSHHTGLRKKRGCLFSLCAFKCKFPTFHSCIWFSLFYLVKNQ